MPFVAPDILIEYRMRQAINKIIENPDVLNEMLSRMVPAAANDLKGFLRNRKINVLGGWPQQEQQVPCVTVQLRPESEAAELQSIDPLTDWIQQGSRMTEWATFNRAVIELTCYGNNQREATFLAMIVKWVLLMQRHKLEEEGLEEQVLSMSDFQPIPSMFDQTNNWFLRTISLNVTYMDTWVIGESPLIADILVTPYDDREEQVSY